MLKLTLKPGEYINIGENVRVIFSGGSANNIHILVDAPRELSIARNRMKKNSQGISYYKETGISKEAHEEIKKILRCERQKQLDNTQN